MSEIRIPFPDPLDADESVIAIIDAAKTLDGEERLIVEQIVHDATARGTTEAADLLDQLESAGPAGRRQVLDKARVGIGLRTVEREEQHERFLSANAALEAARSFSEFPTCAAEGCMAIPLDPVTGGHARVRARRWWCPAHAGEAGPHDHLPPAARLSYSASGAVVDLAEREAEAERQRGEAERQRRRREARQAERREEAAALRQYEEAYRERIRRETPPGCVTW
jgi:hypothetical protein